MQGRAGLPPGAGVGAGGAGGGGPGPEAGGAAGPFGALLGCLWEREGGGLLAVEALSAPRCEGEEMGAPCAGSSVTPKAVLAPPTAQRSLFSRRHGGRVRGLQSSLPSSRPLQTRECEPQPVPGIDPRKPQPVPGIDPVLIRAALPVRFRPRSAGGVGGGVRALRARCPAADSPPGSQHSEDRGALVPLLGCGACGSPGDAPGDETCCIGSFSAVQAVLSAEQRFSALAAPQSPGNL